MSYSESSTFVSYERKDIDIEKTVRASTKIRHDDICKYQHLPSDGNIGDIILRDIDRLFLRTDNSNFNFSETVGTCKEMRNDNVYRRWYFASNGCIMHCELCSRRLWVTFSSSSIWNTDISETIKTGSNCVIPYKHEMSTSITSNKHQHR